MPQKMNGTVTRTLVLLKPDAIERNLTGEILKRFERKGLKIVAAQMRWIDDKLAAEHYQEHKGNEPYYAQMKGAITSGPLMAIILEGVNAVACARQLIGGQSPLHHSPVGTIRADFSVEAPYNLVHGADSDGAAKREITLWFGAEMYKATQPTPKVVKAVPAEEIIGKLMTPPPVPKKLGKVDTVPAPDDLSKYANQLLTFINEQAKDGKFQLLADPVKMEV